ncbi:unnamed protein product [Oppiella nova]|uniref:Alpha-carbonic anhydrase domain-containing protein n=1 Tax=Oppiella nova TaxID=334625 RepID=A0A7R9QG69_9ACAR|nr:unnamed protein product [Oppiella nova]CAG2164350.1 unnamed protein product [Oppiella nova]
MVDFYPTNHRKAPAGMVDLLKNNFDVLKRQYSGGGPDFWGRLNPKWSHCNKGRRQSPIDINPELLLYDPGLLPVHINGDHVHVVPPIPHPSLY